jgi:hypothetical protein
MACFRTRWRSPSSAGLVWRRLSKHSCPTLLLEKLPHEGSDGFAIEVAFAEDEGLLAHVSGVCSRTFRHSRPTCDLTACGRLASLTIGDCGANV